MFRGNPSLSSIKIFHRAKLRISTPPNMILSTVFHVSQNTAKINQHLVVSWLPCRSRLEDVLSAASLLTAASVLGGGVGQESG